MIINSDKCLHIASNWLRRTETLMISVCKCRSSSHVNQNIRSRCLFVRGLNDVFPTQKCITSFFVMISLGEGREGARARACGTPALPEDPGTTWDQWCLPSARHNSWGAEEVGSEGCCMLSDDYQNVHASHTHRHKTTACLILSLKNFGPSRDVVNRFITRGCIITVTHKLAINPHLTAIAPHLILFISPQLLLHEF